MANVALFKPNQTPRLLVSVNTPEYINDADAIIDPNLTAVSNVPHKYWKRNGQQILEMTAQEKLAVDNAEKNFIISQAVVLNIEAITLAKALVKLGVVTKNQLITTIKEVLSNG